MKLAETMKALKQAGTAQNRTIYARHGVVGDQFGVSHANLGKLKKQIKTDHALAQQLWETGNYDARVLATMIADAEQFTAGQLNAWVKDLDNYCLCDAMAAVAARSRHAQAKAQQWTRSTNEWRARVGWSIMAQLAMHDESLPDAYLEKLLESIQRDIGASKNYVRHAMNSALIAIGIRNAKLKRQAIAAAKKIGTVEVDHGETGCKTPEAVPYIEKSWARKQATGKARLRTC